MSDAGEARGKGGVANEAASLRRLGLELVLKIDPPFDVDPAREPASLEALLAESVSDEDLLLSADEGVAR